MRDGHFRIRGKEISRVERLSDAAMVLVATSIGAAAIAGCGKSDVPASSSASPPAAGNAASATATSTSSACPPTGLWAQCSVLYHLDRAGLAPKLDSADTKPEQQLLTGTMFAVKIGQTARLEVYLYPDSAARIADETKLDRSQLVSDTAEQTIKRERTLIESVNLVALLTSLNSHQRERVSDALTAGPPQPPTPR
jgi:hypothetical protein